MRPAFHLLPVTASIDPGRMVNEITSGFGWEGEKMTEAFFGIESAWGQKNVVFADERLSKDWRIL